MATLDAERRGDGSAQRGGDLWMRVGEPFPRGENPLRAVHHVMDNG